jgi:hypothetical protein
MLAGDGPNPTRAVANVTARRCEQLNEKHRTEAPDVARTGARAQRRRVAYRRKKPANSSRVSPRPRSPPPPTSSAKIPNTPGRRIIKMDAAVKAKVEKILGGIA